MLGIKQTEPSLLMPGSITKVRLIAIVLITVAIIFLIRIANNDSSTFVENTYSYALPLTFLICSIFLYFIFTFNSTDRVQIYSFLFLALFIIFTIVIAVYVTRNLGIFNFITPNFLLNCLLGLILFLAFAIFYSIFLNKIVTRPGWVSFSINFLFYIPCLISDGFNYLLSEIFATPKSVFNILTLECIMIITYFYFYPRILESTNANGVVLIENPTMLITKQRIDAPLYHTFSNKMTDPNTKTITISSPIRAEYSISMWVFLNIQPFTQLTYTKEMDIFQYISPDPSGCNCMYHPKVSYLNNRNGIDQYIFYLGPYADKKSAIKYTKSLPHQKWNNFVFNYRSGAVDIFINGEFSTSKDIPIPIPYTDQDSIFIGQDDRFGNERSGIYGSICNIVYYRNMLGKSQIINNYNLLSVKNPPVL